MSKDWLITTIGKICKSVSITHSFNKDQLIFLNTSDVSSGKILHHEYSSINFFPGQAKKSIQKDDVLLSEIRPKNKRFAYVNIDADDYIVSTKLMVLRAENCVNPKYLYYLLTNKKTIDYLQYQAESRSGTFPQITFDEVAPIEIQLPKIPEQKQIAGFFSNLDKYLENMSLQNIVLDKIIQTIFKSWFIDFEFPNEQNKPYKSSGGKMIHNAELQKNIPTTWEVVNLKKEFNLVMGQSPPGNSYNENGDGIIFFQGRTDFGFRFPSVRMYCTKPTRFAKKGDTLVSVRAPVGDINLAFDDCCIGRGLAAIRHKSGHSSYTYYSMMNLKPLFDNFEAEGTVFGAINKLSFEQIQILAPPTKIILLFEKIINALDKKIENNSLQIQKLSDIHDLLLPKLLSGKIRVPVKAR